MKKKIIWFIIFALLVIAIVTASIYINKKGQEYIQNSQTENIETENMLNVENIASTAEENTVNENEEVDNMSVLEVTTQTFQQEVLNSEKTVLIDFYADWCGPCKMLSPVVEEVAQENTDIKVVKINVDNAQELAVKYQIMSIPTLVVVKGGNEVTRSVGVISKTEMLEMIK